MGCGTSAISIHEVAFGLLGASGRSSVRQGQEAFHAKYVLGRKLGQGSFGQVRAAALRPSARQAEAVPTHAVKILDLGCRSVSGFNQRVRDALAEEAAWRAAGTHENILALLDTYVDTGAVKMAYFVMELCQGSLLDQQHRHLLGNAEEFVDVARGMRSGLAHLHGLAIAHRDVKPENFLLGDRATVKLCDFGLASVVPKSGLQGIVGTPPYMAPEMLFRRRYGVGVDTWAYGVTCYVLLLGDFPYKAPGIPPSSAGYKQAVKDGREPPYTPALEEWPALLPCAKDFLKALLTRDARKRPALDDMEAHAFFDSGPEGFASEWASERQDRSHILAAAAAAQKLRRAPVDPTVQKSVDDLLRKLQEQQGPRLGVAQHFSEGERLAPRAPNESKRLSRSSTHDGSVFAQPLSLAAADDVSTVYCQSSMNASLPSSSSSSQRDKDILPMKPAGVETRKFPRRLPGGGGPGEVNVPSRCSL